MNTDEIKLLLKETSEKYFSDYAKKHPKAYIFPKKKNYRHEIFDSLISKMASEKEKNYLKQLCCLKYRSDYRYFFEENEKEKIIYKINNVRITFPGIDYDDHFRILLIDNLAAIPESNIGPFTLEFSDCLRNINYLGLLGTDIVSFYVMNKNKQYIFATSNIYDKEFFSLLVKNFLNIRIKLAKNKIYDTNDMKRKIAANEKYLEDLKLSSEDKLLLKLDN